MSKINLIREEFPKKFRNIWKERGCSEGLVQHDNPLYNNRETTCRSTLWTLTQILKPQQFMEIGTWEGAGAGIVADSMDDLGLSDDAYVTTYDIRPGGYSQSYRKPTNKRVRERYILPHHSDYDTWKYLSFVSHPEFREMTDGEIFQRNLEIFREDMPEGGYPLLSIDGDHSKAGATWDLKYCLELAAPGAVFIVDDLYEKRLNEVREFFDELPYEKYDWRDWNSDRDNPLISMGVFIVD